MIATPSSSPSVTIRQALERLIRKDRLPSALLFHGERGIGKVQLALHLAKGLLCLTSAGGRAPRTTQGCNQCHNCHLVDSGTHPDLHHLDLSDSDTWTTAAFRSFIGSLAMRTVDGGPRIVILDYAESMSLQSANALLKSLEEPRTGTHFILVTAAPTLLPATILSRCQPFYFAPCWSRGDTSENLSSTPQTGPSTEAPPTIIARLAEGSSTVAALLSEHQQFVTLICAGVDAVLSGGSSDAVLRARELAQKKDDMGVKLLILQRYLRCLMRDSSSAPLQRRLAIGLTNALTAERLIIDRNLGAVSVFTAVLDSLSPDAASQPWAVNREQLLSSYTL
jgi:hypothetical protein